MLADSGGKNKIDIQTLSIWYQAKWDNKFKAPIKSLEVIHMLILPPLGVKYKKYEWMNRMSVDLSNAVDIFLNLTHCALQNPINMDRCC